MLRYEANLNNNKIEVDLAFTSLYGENALHDDTDYVYIGQFQSNEEFIHSNYFGLYGEEFPTWLKLNVNATWEILRNRGYDQYNNYYFYNWD